MSRTQEVVPLRRRNRFSGRLRWSLLIVGGLALLMIIGAFAEGPPPTEGEEASFTSTLRQLNEPPVMRDSLWHNP